MGEIWKNVKAFEQEYEVSNLGNVRRKGATKNLAQNNSKSNRYLRVNLSKNNSVQTKSVHVLLGEAFLGYSTWSKNSDGELLVLDHKDNNPLNNTLTNLQIITQKENSAKECRNSWSSSYEGVYYEKLTCGWVTKIKHLNRKIYIGSFPTELEAIEASKHAESNLHLYTGNSSIFRTRLFTDNNRYIYYRKDNGKWRFAYKNVSIQVDTEKEARNIRNEYFKLKT